MTTARLVEIAALLVAPGAIFLTASSHGESVGNAALCLRGASAQLLGLGVVARHLGIATQLLDRVCAEARLRGAVEVGTRNGWTVMRHGL